MRRIARVTPSTGLRTARHSWKTDEAYCRRYGLNPAQREAIRHRNVLELFNAGGNIYYLAKFAGIFGLKVQDLGALDGRVRELHRNYHIPISNTAAALLVLENQRH
jgi:hypothetical protein